MTSTTIRVDIETHALLLELGTDRGASLMDTVRDAAHALHRQQFAHQVSSEIQSLRADTDAWDEYLIDAESTNVGDGTR